MRFRPLSGYMPFKLKAKEIIEKEEKRLSPIGYNQHSLQKPKELPKRVECPSPFT